MDALVAFVELAGFSNIVVLTASVSIVKRERESNRDIPQIFGYCCNSMLNGGKYYEENKIKKYGWWVDE